MTAATNTTDTTPGMIEIHGNPTEDSTARMKKRKVLVLTSTFPRWEGDSEPPFVFDLARRMRDRYQITVLAPHYSGARDRERVSGMDVVRFRYSLPSLERLTYQGGILSNLTKYPLMALQIPFFLFSQLVFLTRIIRKERPDLIHAHWIIPQGVIAVIACFLCKQSPAILCTSHGGDLFGLRQPIASKARKLVYTFAGGFTVVSDAMKQAMIAEGAQKEKITIIPMGVDLKERFYPPPGHRVFDHILFVGRLVEKKGLFYLIRALPKIINRFPASRITVVGDGPERHRCQELAIQLGIEANLEFLGAIANHELPEYYRRAGIVVFPSIIAEKGDQEGFGLVLVEAMGCGCAVIATDLKAMNDIVTDGVNGLVVNAKESEQIADAVMKLMQDSDFADKIGKRARKSVQDKFDWETIAGRYSRVVDMLIDHGVLYFPQNEDKVAGEPIQSGR